MADRDSIRVEHRYKVQNKVLPKGNRTWIVQRSDQVQHTVCTPLCWDLARMDPSRDEQDRLLDAMAINQR